MSWIIELVITLTTLRKIDPTLSHVTDEELENIRKSFYDFGELIFEDWKQQKFDSKFPVRSLTDKPDEHTI